MFQMDGVNPSSATNCNSRRCCRGKKTTSLNNISSGLLLLLVSHFTCQRRRRTHRCQSATTSNLLLFSWTAAVAVWLFSATPAFAVAKGPVAGSDPEFVEPLQNLTVTAGRDVKLLWLLCSFKHLGSYKGGLDLHGKVSHSDGAEPRHNTQSSH